MPNGGETAAILIVALARRYGGIDTRVVQMAKALHGRRPYWVAVAAGSPLHAELSAQGLNALALPFAPRSLRNVPALMRIMREKTVALVDAQNPQSYLLGILAAALAGVPGRICTVHLDFRRLDGGWLRRAMLRTLTMLCRRLGCHFIAVSWEIAGYLTDAGVPDARVTIGINAIAPLPLSESGDPRAEFGWTAEDFVLAVPARLEMQKGHAHLLAALEQLHDERAGLKCLIIGDGRLRAPLEAEAARRGLRDVVHFAGFRRDVPALVRAADLVCLPSLFEGLPFAAIEAAQCGVPILASAVGGVAEHFTHGVTARLVPPSDAEALVREIRWCRAHRDRLPGLGDAARALVADRFSPERMLTEITGAYDRALGRGREEAGRYSGFPTALLRLLRCPRDGGPLGGGNGDRIVDGELCCTACGARYPVIGGIVRLLEGVELEGECGHERRLRDRHSAEEHAFATADPANNAMEMSAMFAALRPRGRVILELGCGTGRFTTALAGSAKAVLAMDFSLEALRILAGQLPADAAVGLVHADIAHFAVAPAAFGGCLSTLASNLPNAAYRDAMYGVAALGLERGGRFVFSTHHHTLRDRLHGVLQAGRYSVGGIYRYKFRQHEIVGEALRHFGSVRARPIQVRLPLVRRLGMPAFLLSRLSERLPLVNGLGDLLLVRAERPIARDMDAHLAQ